MFGKQIIFVVYAALFTWLALSLPARSQTTPLDDIVFIEDGAPSKELHLPVYEWAPKKESPHGPHGMILAIHGLTLHGLSYELLGKASAAGGYYFVAPDMRGYGKCRKDKENRYADESGSRQKIDYNKSYEDMVRLAQWMKRKYPTTPLTVLGESLGCTMALRVAAGHPELVDSIVMSSPVAKIHPLMFLYPGNVRGLLSAVFLRPKADVSLRAFMQSLVSNDLRIGKEMVDDPLVTKRLTLSELLKSVSFLEKTVKYAKGVAPNTSVLILQGSQDYCVVPHALARISENIRSSDQTLRWLDHHGHLLLETHYMRAATVAALTDWVDDHEPARLSEISQIEQDIRALGGKSDD